MNKIFVDANVLTLKHYGGIPTYVSSLLENIDLEKRSLFTLIANRESPPTFDGTYDSLKFGIKRHLGWLLFGIKVNKHNPDVFWGCSFSVPRLISSKTKLVVTVYDTIPFTKLYKLELKPTTISKKLRDYIMNLPLMKSSIKRADVIVTISNSSAQKISDLFPFASKKIKIVAPAYDKKLFHYVSDNKILEDFLDRHQIRERFILAMNMKMPRKNFNLLINTFKNVKSEGILCVGGTLEDYQLSFAEQKLGKRFKYLGYLKTEELPLVYSTASALVAPSLAEGFDMPPLEARACGTHVIASNIPVHHEILEGEAEYFGIQDDKKLTSLIEEVLSSEKSIKESNIINKYDWKQSADKMLKILTEF